MISKGKTGIERQDHIIEIPVVQFLSEEAVVFRLIVQITVGLQEFVPFLQKIVFGTVMYALIHDIYAEACEAVCKMFDHMKRISCDTAVRQILKSYIFIGQPEIDRS